jgi:16S rRNA (guanine966-N2)-methyltransferase
MRIIAGKLSGRRFGAPSGRGTRPTSDRVREALASALQARGAFDGALVLDLFAGTGALSFEALSRGASFAVAVDDDGKVVRQLTRSARELGVEADLRVMRADLLRNPSAAVEKLPSEHGRFTLVFADAPYSEIETVPAILTALMDARLLAPGAWVLVEHPSTHDWRWPNGLASDAEYRYGQTGISLGVYEPEKGSP